MRLPKSRRFLVVPLALCALLAGGAVRRAQDTCGPFTDVSALFCPYVLEAYYTGITAGTSPTTFSPDLPITRGQTAVFAAKGLNQALARSSRRAALGQWWTTTASGLGLTTVPASGWTVSDGADVWVSSQNAVSRVRASDGKVLEAWTSPYSLTAGLLSAMGRIFAVGYAPDGESLLMIDPSQSPGPMTEVAHTDAGVLAFDGSRIWATEGPSFALSIITPGPTTPWLRTEVNFPGNFEPQGIVYDGSNMWVTMGSGGLLKLDANGAILQTVAVSTPGFPVFDGANIWVPSFDGSVSVVRASDGQVIAVLTGNGLTQPIQAAFDGRRVLIVSSAGMSLWSAADLSPLGFTPLDGAVFGACSDGVNFWIPVYPDKLIRL